jgi:hypothetical protein
LGNWACMPTNLTNKLWNLKKKYVHCCVKKTNRNEFFLTPILEWHTNILKNYRNTWYGLIWQWGKHECRTESPYRYSVVPLCWPTVAATQSTACFVWTEGSAASLFVKILLWSSHYYLWSYLSSLPRSASEESQKTNQEVIQGNFVSLQAHLLFLTVRLSRLISLLALGLTSFFLKCSFLQISFMQKGNIIREKLECLLKLNSSIYKINITIYFF